MLVFFSFANLPVILNTSTAAVVQVQVYTIYEQQQLNYYSHYCTVVVQTSEFRHDERSVLTKDVGRQDLSTLDRQRFCLDKP